MTYDLRELYQEVIIDHNNNPRNQYEMPNATSVARGVNPLCGDKVTVYLNLKDNHVETVSFIGSGCAISQASSSLMTEAVLGKSIEEAEALFENFHALLTQDNHPIDQNLKKLAVFSNVKAFPARVKCATLAWHTFEACLHKDNTVVTTE